MDRRAAEETELAARLTAALQPVQVRHVRKHRHGRRWQTGRRRRIDHPRARPEQTGVVGDPEVGAQVRLPNPIDATPLDRASSNAASTPSADWTRTCTGRDPTIRPSVSSVAGSSHLGTRTPTLTGSRAAAARSAPAHSDVSGLTLTCTPRPKLTPASIVSSPSRAATLRLRPDGVRQIDDHHIGVHGQRLGHPVRPIARHVKQCDHRPAHATTPIARSLEISSSRSPSSPSTVSESPTCQTLSGL